MKSKTLVICLLMAITFYANAQDLPIKDTSKTVAVSNKILDNYTGYYRIEAMSLIIEIIRENNSLYAIVAGMGKVLLNAGSQQAFSNNDIQAQIEFPSTNSKAQKLTLYQAGQQLTGQRIEPPKELDYDKVLVGDSRIDYSKIYSPFESQWDLIIRGNKVGTASIHLRHAIYEGQPAYHAGSIIRYTAMGNKPFADMGFFSKTDYRVLQARNAVSQQDEITTTVKGTTHSQSTININTGEITSAKTANFDQVVFGAGVYKLLSMELETGLTVQLPVSGFDNIAWEKALISGREQVHIESHDKSYDAWRIEYSSGTIKWVIDEAPYLIKWQMPTGMLWELKELQK